MAVQSKLFAKDPEVLWVEDVPDTARGALRRLEFKTHRGIAHFAGNVQSARSELQRRRWMAVVFDLQLPLDPDSKDTVSDNAGPDLIRALKNGELGPYNRDVPFVVHTAISSDARLASETGCMGVFHKVDNPDPMVNLLAEHINAVGPTLTVSRWRTPALIRSSDQEDATLFIDAWDTTTPIQLKVEEMPPEVRGEIAVGRFPVPVLVEAMLGAEAAEGLNVQVLSLTEVPSDEELGL